MCVCVLLAFLPPCTNNNINERKQRNIIVIFVFAVRILHYILYILINIRDTSKFCKFLLTRQYEENILMHVCIGDDGCTSYMIVCDVRKAPSRPNMM